VQKGTGGFFAQQKSRLSFLQSQCSHHGGPGFKPTVASRDAGVEPTGMTSRRVGVSLARCEEYLFATKNFREA